MPSRFDEIETQSSLDLGPSYRLGQRWFARRASYRPAQEPIRAAEYFVDRIDRIAAKTFVEREHYSRTFVYEIASYGLFHKAGVSATRLVGVAAFSTPSNPNTIEHWTGIPDFRQGAELGRFVLADSVAGNGETFFLARALQRLKADRPELRAILSYSDPVPRRSLVTGDILFRGHYGSIYQAHNALYLGRASAKTLFLGPDGSAIPPRILTKLRNGELGADSAQDRIEVISGLLRAVHESPASFIERALKSPSLRRIRHPGNHLYLFPLAVSRTEKKVILALPAVQAHLTRGLPYPKLLDRAA
jgi:hypothetical protein